MFPAGSTDISQRFITLSTGVTLRVVEGGPQDGTPVLMLPGWGAPAYMYRHAFGELPRRGFRIIVAEQRGFGLSTKPVTPHCYTRGEYIADVDALITALGHERIAVVGQSMGGAVALRFALRVPQRVTQLVLINPAGLVSLRFFSILKLLPTEVMGFLGARAVPRWVVEVVLRVLAYGDPKKVREEDVDEYWAPTQLDGSVRASRVTLSEFEWDPVSDAEGSALAVPALVMLGRTDRLISNDERSAKKLAGASVCWLPGGHCAHEEAPEEAYRAIAEFLAPAR
jgi:pimeloyl-ACP methyl ester carboxylesterase